MAQAARRGDGRTESRGTKLRRREPSVRLWRRSLNLGVDQAARLLGMSEDAYTELERREPTRLELLALLAAWEMAPPDREACLGEDMITAPWETRIGMPPRCDGPKDTRVTFQAPVSLRDRAREIAGWHGLSFSDVCHRLLADWRNRALAGGDQAFVPAERDMAYRDADVGPVNIVIRTNGDLAEDVRRLCEEYEGHLNLSRLMLGLLVVFVRENGG